MPSPNAAAGPPEMVARPSRRWGRVVVVVFALLAVLACAAWAGRWGIRRWTAQRELDAAVAALDRADPGWRLDELEGGRKSIPDEQNAAVAVTAIRQLLPPAWKPRDPPARPERRISPAQAEELRQELRAAAPALEKARALADYAEGRCPLRSPPDPIDASPGSEDARKVALLLRLQAKLLAEDNDGDGALAAAAGALAAARAIGDEPRLLAQQLRLQCQTDALEALKRTLAQTQPSEAALARLQRALQGEDQAPTFLWAAQGERAGHHQLALAAEAGDIPSAKILLRVFPEASFFEEQFLGPSPGTALRQCHAQLLGYLTLLVELARRPCEEQGPLIRKLATERTAVIDGYELFQGLEYRARSLPDLFRRQTALIRCGIVALAAERYRLAHGRWPDAIEALVPARLAAVPTDPVAGGPLHLKREKDGLAIQTSGSDVRDEGEPPRPSPAAVVSVRLWDVAARRQEPRPDDPGARPMRGPAGGTPDR